MPATDQPDDRQAENPYRSPAEKGSPTLGLNPRPGWWLFLSAVWLGMLACISVLLALDDRQHFGFFIAQAGGFAVGCGGAVLLALAQRRGSERIRLAGLIVALFAGALLAWAWSGAEVLRSAVAVG